MSLTSVSHILLPSNANGNLEAVPLQQLNSSLTGKADVIHDHTLSQITDAGTAAALNTGTTSGTIPVLDTNGHLPSSTMPAIATFQFVNVEDETERLGLTSDQVQPGDMAFQAEDSSGRPTLWMLIAPDPSESSNWVRVISTSEVLSVNGYTGVVLLSASDVGAIATTARGAMNGVASLGADTKVPVAQLPASVAAVLDTLILRDEDGKAYVATPDNNDASDTVATIGFVNTAIAEINIAGGISGTILTSSTTNAPISSPISVNTPNITFHDVARTGSYNDLLNLPNLADAFIGTYYTSATSQSVVGSATTLNAANIIFHNISKTGAWADMVGKPTIQSSATGQATIASPTTFPNALVLHDVAFTGDYDDLLNLPTIPVAFTGTYLTSDVGQAAVPTAVTLNSANITFHTLAKSGNWVDMLGRPTLETSATSQAKIATAAVIPTTLVLHDVSRTGDYIDLLNKPNIPAVYSGTITGTGALTEFTVTHNLGSQRLVVQVYKETVSGTELVLIQTRNATINTTVLNFSLAPASTDIFDVNIIRCN